MHADDAEAAPVEHQFGHGRTARLQRRQFQRACRHPLHRSADEEGIAMPADALAALRNGNGLPRRIVEQGARQDAGTLAEPHVRFLQGDDVGIDLTQHRDDAVGILPPVDTDCLMDIVAGEFELH